jgi:hypothetical protein
MWNSEAANMADALVRFTEAIRDENGASYHAQASGAVGTDGLWEGWIEFVGADGTSLRTPRETEQPNRIALIYWAEGLSVAYLEGALHRALDALVKPAVHVPAVEHSIFNAPASDVRAGRTPRPSRPVLDPFAIHEQGEGVLRQQLSALSRDHLLAIVDAYALPVGVEESTTDRELADSICAAVSFPRQA